MKTKIFHFFLLKIFRVTQFMIISMKDLIIADQRSGHAATQHSLVCGCWSQCCKDNIWNKHITTTGDLLLKQLLSYLGPNKTPSLLEFSGLDCLLCVIQSWSIKSLTRDGTLWVWYVAVVLFYQREWPPFYEPPLGKLAIASRRHEYTLVNKYSFLQRQAL